jgi:7,8-dihydropterin-6-yl-methyl-4-(beta-D-ribofuranosyl)aminobenzene 5'-phosphate synthase
MEVNLTVLYDNNRLDPRLKTAWGFSCLVRAPEKTILFDTGGDGHTLLRNMKHLGLEPLEVDIVVLSHFHDG